MHITFNNFSGIFQSVNDRESQQKILLSGDIEENPGPPHDTDTLGNRREQCGHLADQVGNNRLSKQKLLLSGDVELNPGPLDVGHIKVGFQQTETTKPNIYNILCQSSCSKDVGHFL